jgi:hypothetical protein
MAISFTIISTIFNTISKGKEVFHLEKKTLWKARGSVVGRGTMYDTNRKVAGSIPDVVIGFFNLPNPSSRTMALGFTQPLTEMSTRKLPGG